LLHLYSAFYGTPNRITLKGESPQPPPMCNVWRQPYCTGMPTTH